MYSLYRAWLMRDTVTAASWTTPPDLIITVGNLASELREETLTYGYQFVAHKQLVSMHSGYLKSLIQNEPSSSGMPVTNIALPNISSETFAPLLSFMYTGYLDLTSDNIYSVLLATHLLHMPRALDLCRAYLVHNQQSNCPPEPFPGSQPASKLIKPIPSRKIQNLGTSIWSPVNVPPVMLQTRPDGPFQCVSPSEKRPKLRDYTKPDSPLAVPSTSKTLDLSSESSAPSPTFSSSSFTCDDRTVNVVRAKHKRSHRKRDCSGKTPKKINNENQLKVEFDVACCDGPVRFHRVLNESYGTAPEDGVPDDSAIATATNMADDLDKVTEKEYLENYPKTQFLKLKSSNFSSFMHQQMLNSNTFRKSSRAQSSRGVIQMRKLVKNEIAPTVEDPSDPDNGDKQDPADKSFTCLYCNHTFKSHYCYQKHARRHINSLPDETRTDSGAENVGEMRNDGPRDVGSGNPRREVRLLDMNVQYYPCKTCGSKFPSYYFVHKHRKLCHANEDTPCDDSNNLPNADSSSSDRMLRQQQQETLAEC